MLVLSIFIKNNSFSKYSSNYLEHKILKINCFLLCVFAGFIFIKKLVENSSSNYGALIYIISPLIIYYAVSLIFSEKTIPISFKRIFNTDSLSFDDFIGYAQYIIVESNSINDSINLNFC
jgi:hypothetical protein